MPAACRVAGGPDRHLVAVRRAVADRRLDLVRGAELVSCCTPWGLLEAAAGALFQAVLQGHGPAGPRRERGSMYWEAIAGYGLRGVHGTRGTRWRVDQIDGEVVVIAHRMSASRVAAKYAALGKLYANWSFLWCWPGCCARPAAPGFPFMAYGRGSLYQRLSAGPAERTEKARARGRVPETEPRGRRMHRRRPQHDQSLRATRLPLLHRSDCQGRQNRVDRAVVRGTGAGASG